MPEANTNSGAPYQPEAIDPPPLYVWPPKPFATLKWLTIDLMVPWGVFWIVTAVVCWHFFTPDMAQMQYLEAGWIAQIWVRNALLLALVAGGLHWWFYIKKAQDKETKFTSRWLATDDEQFLFRNQVKDNMFWSLVSGVSIWTFYEALTYWWYANGNISFIVFSETPGYFIFSIWLVFFWSTFHFYLNHRALHWQPLYKVSHELHHRNVNTGPWTGISMHPIEHVIYFSVFLIWWVVPAHPVLIILCGLFQGVSPSVSHCGFDYLKLGGKLKLPTGDNFHNLHHRFFHINYGNSMTPVDKLFDSWHNGGEQGKAVLKKRMRNRPV